MLPQIISEMQSASVHVKDYVWIAYESFHTIKP
jgi:hypothetical protein